MNRYKSPGSRVTGWRVLQGPMLILLGMLVQYSAQALDRPADLAVKRFLHPAIFSPGMSMNMQMVVMNQGGSPARNFELRITLGRRGYLKVLRRHHVRMLLPARSITPRIRVRIPRNLRPGRYRLCALADYPRRIREISETNNRVCRMVTVARQLPDLAASFTISRNLLRPGGSFVLRIRDKNIGIRPAPRHAIRAFLVKGSRRYHFAQWFQAAALTPGASRLYTRNYRLPIRVAPGRYRLCVATDYGNRIGESSEANNMPCTGVRVHGPRISNRLPDLVAVIRNARIQNGRLGFSYRVTNRGQGRASVSKLRITYVALRRGARPQILATHIIPALAPAASYGHRTRRGYDMRGVQPGRYRLCASADFYRTVRESSERNNTTCTTFEIPRALRSSGMISGTAVTTPRRLPDLEVRLFTGGNLPYGRAIRVHFTDHNGGNAMAPAHRIQIYLRDKGRRIPVGLGEVRAPALQPHTSREYRHRVILPRVSGNMQLCVMTDAGRSVREMRENNNARCTGVTLLGGPGLRRRVHGTPAS